MTESKPEHRANGPYYPIGLLGGEYCVKCRTAWPCSTQRYQCIYCDEPRFEKHKGFCLTRMEGAKEEWYTK